MSRRSSELARAVRGPIMLITLGVLLALDVFGYLPFRTSWPVLIIAFGLLTLLERMLARDGAGYGQGTPAGGSISGGSV